MGSPGGCTGMASFSIAGTCPVSDHATYAHISRPSDKYISLILPAYNEEARLRITLDEMLR
jgi:hypothetical protein